MRVLIVHAHHEPKSFCGALFRQAAHTLSEAGHDSLQVPMLIEQAKKECAQRAK